MDILELTVLSAPALGSLANNLAIVALGLFAVLCIGAAFSVQTNKAKPAPKKKSKKKKPAKKVKKKKRKRSRKKSK